MYILFHFKICDSFSLSNRAKQLTHVFHIYEIGTVSLLLVSFVHAPYIRGGYNPLDLVVLL